MKNSLAAMERVQVDALLGAQETLLIPLWARAVEARRSSPMLRDAKALEIVDSVNYDFDKFAAAGVSSLNFCSRAVVIDRIVRDFLAEHPAATVVEIGAGLDSRFERVGNAAVRWFDLDLPEVIDVRRRFYEETARRSFLPSSVLDPGWLAEVQPQDPSDLLLVAEGVFYFLSEPQLRELFAAIARRFPGSRIVFDTQSPLYLLWSRLRHPLRDSKKLQSIRDVRQVERWSPQYEIEQTIGFGDSPHYDGHLHRFPPLYRLACTFFPPTRRMFTVSVVRLGKPAPP